MPMYEEECTDCGCIQEYYVPSNAGVAQHKCPKCSGVMERLYSLAAIQIFKEYTTNHILPQGKPITITSSRQEAAVLKENGLCKADSNPTK
jgi:putative FmdB family regulatory protein